MKRKPVVQREPRGEAFHPRFTNVLLFRGRPIRVDTHPAKHGCHEIMIPVSGVYGWDEGDGRGEQRARAGDALYWPPFTQRTEWNEPSPRLRMLAAFFDWPDPVPLPRRVCDKDRVLATLGWAMDTAKGMNLRDRPRVLNAYLEAMIAEFLRMADEPRGALVEQVAQFTEAHMNIPFGLEDLAKGVDLSPDHLIRRYRTLTGKTPMQAVRQMKCAHVIGTLRGTQNLPLHIVAGQVGLRHASQLCRLIREQTGYPPRFFRPPVEQGARRKPAKRG